MTININLNTQNQNFNTYLFDSVSKRAYYSRYHYITIQKQCLECLPLDLALSSFLISNGSCQFVSVRRVLQFNNKMEQTFGADQSEMALSPKQTEHHRYRTFTLQKIDSEIEKIKSLNSLQNQHYKDSIQIITLIENTYQRENLQIKAAFTLLKEQHESLQKMYLSLKDEFQANLIICQKFQQSNKDLSKQVSRLKAMVRNQQNLIDQYRKSIEEEISLQKQLIKSEYEEQKAKMSKSFNKALQQLEKQYEEKFRKLHKQQKIKQYRNQFNQAKQYLISREISKGNLNEKMLKPSNSEYSTVEQESKPRVQEAKTCQVPKGQYNQQNRHNQPVFFV